MRIFIAGASGVIGRALVPRLYLAGHGICAVARHAVRPYIPESSRLATCTLDILDAKAVREAIHAFEPDVIIHLATDLPGNLDPRKVGPQLAATNRLRDEGTRNLLAGIPAGKRVRFIAPGFALAHVPGDGLADEDTPLYRDAPGGFAPAVVALRSLEEQVVETPGIKGVVLRLGALYGPDTAYDRYGGVGAALRSRVFPIVGNGSGVWSFLHVEDAVGAVVRALEVEPGIYNVVDDKPARVAEWLHGLAHHHGVKPPRRIPAWLAKWFIGEFGLHMMLSLRGVSNRRFREATGWKPRLRPW